MRIHSVNKILLQISTGTLKDQFSWQKSHSGGKFPNHNGL